MGFTVALSESRQLVRISRDWRSNNGKSKTPISIIYLFVPRLSIQTWSVYPTLFSDVDSVSLYLSYLNQRSLPDAGLCPFRIAEKVRHKSLYAWIALRSMEISSIMGGIEPGCLGLSGFPRIPKSENWKRRTRLPARCVRIFLSLCVWFPRHDRKQTGITTKKIGLLY